MTPMKGSFISRGVGTHRLRITDLASCEWSPVSEFLLLGHDLWPLNLKELYPFNTMSPEPKELCPFNTMVDVSSML